MSNKPKFHGPVLRGMFAGKVIGFDRPHIEFMPLPEIRHTRPGPDELTAPMHPTRYRYMWCHEGQGWEPQGDQTPGVRITRERIPHAGWTFHGLANDGRKLSIYVTLQEYRAFKGDRSAALDLIQKLKADTLAHGVVPK